MNYSLTKQVDGWQFGKVYRICGRFKEMGPGVRKQTMWILTRSDTNQAVQPLKMARGLKFCI